MRIRIYARVAVGTARVRGEASRKNLAKTERIVRLFDDTPENRAILKKASKDGRVMEWEEAFALVNTSDKWQAVSYE